MRLLLLIAVLLSVGSILPSRAVAQTAHDKCLKGDAPSCFAYGRTLAAACSRVSQKTPAEVLQCQYGAQCYQDKGMALSQGNSARADASCDTGGDSTAMGAAGASAQKLLSIHSAIPPGLSTFVNWWLNSTPNLTLSLVGGSEDDRQNVAFDQVVRLPLHLCAAGFLVSGKVVMVPGKWLNDRCNAVWENTYLEAQQFLMAERYPIGSHGYWGGLNAGPADKRLYGPPGDDGTRYLPCMVHYQIQKDGLDRAISALTGDSLVQETGDQLGYVVGSSCRFEFASRQVNSGDNVRVYYLIARPSPPPIPVKAPTVPQQHAQGRGTEWTITNQRSNAVMVYTQVHDPIAGLQLDCRNQIYKVTIDAGATWAVWVDDGKVLDAKFYEDTQGNGGCSANSVADRSLTGKSNDPAETMPIQ